MCKAVEFKDLKFRAGEKGEYIEWNKREELQWPIRKVSESCDKVNILIQVGFICNFVVRHVADPLFYRIVAIGWR